MAPSRLSTLLALGLSASTVFAQRNTFHPRASLNASASAPTGIDAATFAKTKFDFVVVGGGTAGLVLAYRLSENPHVTVGVLEAGEYRPNDKLIETPTAGNLLGNANVGTLIGNPTYDWGLQSVPQAALNGLVIDYPRGKVVGGSSAINSMIWQRASAEEYDNWESVFQNPGWNFAGLEPYFKKVEDWTPPELLFPEQHYDPALATEHGQGGPIDVSYDTFLTDVDAPSIAAANALGIPTNSNPDGGNVTYLSLTARSVDPARGIRKYAGNSYYQPVQNRTNLKLLADATVMKVDFAKRGGKGAIVATGVEYAVGGKNYTVSVGKEVILAAGSLKTPQILELSGIGNKTILNGLGIDVILDFPQIGENFQDHPVTLLEFKVKDDVLTLDRLNYNQTYAQEQEELYNTNATGALTFTEAVIGPLPLQRTVNESMFNTMLSGLNASLAAQGSQTPIQKAQYAALTKLMTGGEVGWFELTVVPSGGVAGPTEKDTNYLTSVAIELHPFGRGFVHVNTTDPYAQPVIDPKFLEIPFDAEVLVHGSQWVRKWMETQPIAGLIDSETVPSLNVTSDAQWDAYIRTAVRTTNHPLGTTAMASRELGGVVGPDLKVYGLNNVRIVDAGIIPMTLGVAIQSTVYAIAEKAADIVKEAYNL